MKRKKLLFTVTNDLSYDQRMIRICSSLSASGYEVILIGRKMPGSIPLEKRSFQQKRLSLVFNKGVFFYIEYNIRLFFYLLFKKNDLICAIDLDSIIPCYLVSCIKNSKRVYDAHELFCEMKEVVSRPFIYKCWKTIERWMVPRFTAGYTVNMIIAAEFNRMYRVHYEVIRNMPVLTALQLCSKKEKYILYQGAINEGRSFETLIPAMKKVNAPLVVCGDGNFMQQAKELVRQNGLDNKIIFKGKIPPESLKEFTQNAYIGITLFDRLGLSNYYSLANRFFDYMHAGVPQICVNYPVYRSIVDDFPFAVLVNDIGAENIARTLNELLSNEAEYLQLQQNCLKARQVMNWQEEEKVLIEFYRKIIPVAG